MPRNPSPSSSLRKSLIAQASAYVGKHQLPSQHYFTSGPGGVTLFKHHVHLGTAQHHNFQLASYSAIRNDAQWAARLQKRHNCKYLPPGTKELDSCCSSDALLMNIFCYPGAAAVLAPLFGLTGKPTVHFGFKPKLAFIGGWSEPRSSEIDLRLGAGGKVVLCEAKLTEPGFTSKGAHHVNRYRYLHKVFDTSKLPQQSQKFSHYQLIRNILAAHECNARFYLIHDSRRPDLRMAFDMVRAAINDPKLRALCGMLTWQQIARQLPVGLKRFLLDKYGIK